MKKWITDRPYLLTTIIFLIVMIFGWRVLYWQEEDFGFLLLLYFIVTLGIRLDDISRKMGIGSGKPLNSSSEKETLAWQLNDIRFSLQAISDTLGKLLKAIEKQEDSAKDPEP